MSLAEQRREYFEATFKRPDVPSEYAADLLGYALNDNGIGVDDTCTDDQLLPVAFLRPGSAAADAWQLVCMRRARNYALIVITRTKEGHPQLSLFTTTDAYLKEILAEKKDLAAEITAEVNLLWTDLLAKGLVMSKVHRVKIMAGARNTEKPADVNDPKHASEPDFVVGEQDDGDEEDLQHFRLSRELLFHSPSEHHRLKCMASVVTPTEQQELEAFKRKTGEGLNAMVAVPVAFWIKWLNEHRAEEGR